MRLDWSDYKHEEDGHRTVFFPGGFQLCVVNIDKQWRPTKKWRVWYGDQGPQIKGLTDQWFKTRQQAMLAAEAVFYPMVEIAPKLVDHNITIAVTGVLAPTSKK